MMLTLHALLAGHGLLLALAGTGVAPCPLATYGKSLAMSLAPIRSNITQSLNMLLNLTTQCTFNDVRRIDESADLAHLLIRQLGRALVRIDQQDPATTENSRVPE